MQASTRHACVLACVYRSHQISVEQRPPRVPLLVNNRQLEIGVDWWLYDGREIREERISNVYSWSQEEQVHCNNPKQAPEIDTSVRLGLTMFVQYPLENFMSTGEKIGLKRVNGDVVVDLKFHYMRGCEALKRE